MTTTPARIETATNDFTGADGKTYTATITTEYLENGTTRTRTEWSERPAAGVGIIPAGEVVSKTTPDHSEEIAEATAMLQAHPECDGIEVLGDSLTWVQGGQFYDVKVSQLRAFIDGMKADAADEVEAQPMEITEALEDLRTEFLAKYAEDLAAHVDAQRAAYRQKGVEIDERAWEIYKLTGLEHVCSRCSQEVQPSKPGDVYLQYFVNGSSHGLTEEVRAYVCAIRALEMSRKRIMNKLDRLGYGVGKRSASPQQVAKMAARAWAKRLDTLEKGIERNGVQLATAKVTGYSSSGGDYVLFIQDAQGNGVHARSILAGGAGTCVRLHLRFICT